MLLFLNKHRPMSLNDLVFPNNTIEQEIRRYVSQRIPRSLILYGPFGSGKSMIIDVIARVLSGDGYEHNRTLFFSATEKDTVAKIATIRKTFDLVPFGSSYHVAQINELHTMPANTQVVLRDVLDTCQNYSNAVILATANDLSKVDGGVRDRCAIMYVGEASPDRWLPRTKQILAREKVVLPDDIVLQQLTNAVGNGRGSIRTIMATLHALVEQAREFASQPETSP